MKRILLSLVLAAGIFAIGCDHPSSVTPQANAKEPKLKNLLLPLSTAQEYIRVYDSICDTVFKKVPIRAYTVRSEDLIAAMGLPDSVDSLVAHKFIRVYLGYDLAHKPHAGFKLFIVPVDDASLAGNDPANWKGGSDVYLDDNGKVIGPGDPASTPNVLDLNAPCPNTCSTEGSLNPTGKK